MKKTAVIFPGIGYSTAMPLLYYARKMAIRYGYEIVELPYTLSKDGVRGNAEKIREVAKAAMEQAEAMLLNKGLKECGDLLFISKSIGTAIAAAYDEGHSLNARHVFFTPLKETFYFAREGCGIAFHGTNDPWAEDSPVRHGALEKKIPLIEIPNANHSLETGDIRLDIKNLAHVMDVTEKWMQEWC